MPGAAGFSGMALSNSTTAWFLSSRPVTTRRMSCAFACGAQSAAARIVAAMRRFMSVPSLATLDRRCGKKLLMSRKTVKWFPACAKPVDGPFARPDATAGRSGQKQRHAGIAFLHRPLVSRAGADPRQILHHVRAARDVIGLEITH